MDSADSPLAVHGLYAGGHHQHHRHNTEEVHELAVGLLAVIPLALQFSTGRYLFALPYATKWRSVRGAH